MRLKRRDKRMTNFMIRNGKLLFVGKYLVLLLITGDNGLYAFFHVFLRHISPVHLDCAKCRLIYHIRKLGSGCARSRPRDRAKVNVITHFTFFA